MQYISESLKSARVTLLVCLTAWSHILLPGVTDKGRKAWTSHLSTSLPLQKEKQTPIQNIYMCTQTAGTVEYASNVPINDLFTSSNCDLVSKYSTPAWTVSFVQQTKPQTSVSQRCSSQAAGLPLHSSTKHIRTKTAIRGVYIISMEAFFFYFFFF